MADVKFYKSEAMQVLHETAEGLHDAGLIDAENMQKFDKACLMDRSKPCWRYEWFWRKPAVVGLYLFILGSAIWLFSSSLNSPSGIEISSVIGLSITAAISVIAIAIFSWYTVKDWRAWNQNRNS